MTNQTQADDTNIKHPQDIISITMLRCEIAEIIARLKSPFPDPTDLQEIADALTEQLEASR